MTLKGKTRSQNETERREKFSLRPGVMSVDVSIALEIEEVDVRNANNQNELKSSSH